MTEPRTRKLKGPDGKDLVLTDLPDDPSVSLASAITDTIPERIHGFVIETKLGPYPPDSPHSHRKGFYVYFRPSDKEARRACKKAAKEFIISFVDLTPEGVIEFEQNPQGPVAEGISVEVYRAGLQKIHELLEGTR
jgi:hypothetical protein